jgi:ketosteroid isomerase-like protein
VRRAYEATNHGDYDVVESLFHPGIEFHIVWPIARGRGLSRQGGGREYNEELFRQFASIRFEIGELVDAGDRVVVMTTQHAVPKGGQHEMNVEVAEVWVTRDGLLAGTPFLLNQGRCPRRRRAPGVGTRSGIERLDVDWAGQL